MSVFSLSLLFFLVFPVEKKGKKGSLKEILNCYKKRAQFSPLQR